MLKNIDLTNQKVLILGYAMTGKSVAEFLLEQGANITINDRGDLSKDPSVTLLLSQGAKIVSNGHPIELLDEGFDFIVKNPGIPYSLPIIQKALERKLLIYTDVELASWFSEAPIIGVTGSNGKTTTTSLIYQLLSNRSKGQAYLAGNIGIPSLEVAKKAQMDDDVIIELSSFQLMGIEKFKAKIAVICNIFEAHLDYHGSREEYIKAKLNLVKNLTSEDQIVYNYDQQEFQTWLANTEAERVPFAVDQVDEFVQKNGAYVIDSAIYFKGEKVAEVTDIQIPGKHNVENALAAIAVAKLKNVSNESIKQSLHQFQGVAYRIQPIGQSQGRSFFNDSKATNITATITALKSFKQSIVFVGGGLDRGNEFDELIPYLKQVRAAYLYGETKHKMKNAFELAGVSQVELFDTLDEATTVAYRAAESDETVLLSPSCASWDQFKTFEERGKVFTDLIQRLIIEEPYQEK